MHRGAALGSHPEVGEGSGEGCLLTGQDHITEGRGGCSAANAGTVDSSNDGFGELDENVETLLIALSYTPLD